MGETKIEWTERTWNPIRGCTRVSSGCGGPGPHGGCYAEAIAARFSKPGQPYHGVAEMRDGKPRWTGKLAFSETALLEPLKRRKPTVYFVNSMSDLFHEKMPEEWIDRVFAVMALCPQHVFQVLTKRPARMRAYSENPKTPERVWREVDRLIDQWHDGTLSIRLLCFEGDAKLPALAAQGAAWGGQLPWPLRNVWLGTSCEDQATADARIPDLLATPAAVRFVSAEPLLGPIDFHEVIPEPLGWSFRYGFNGLDWVIVGGESGPTARPMHPAWARSIRDQCAAAGVPFFFKQWGDWHPCEMKDGVGYPMPGHAPFDSWKAPVFDSGITAGWNWRRLGKRRAGRLLDGVEHNGMPLMRQSPSPSSNGGA